MRPAILTRSLLATLCLLGFLGCSDKDADDEKIVPEMVVIPSFSNAIAVEDQPAGEPASLIMLASVALDAPGYVVVREALATQSMFPGDVIGVLPLNASGSDISMELDRAVSPGERLFATLHVESNGNDTFDFATSPGIDPPALDAMGLPASSVFFINVGDPVISVSDQSSDERAWISQVTIDAITSSRPESLIALHESLDDLTRPVGIKALSGLSFQDVRVTLTEPVPHATQLIAVLHEDLGTRGVFEPDLDLPLRANDMLIASPFTVTLERVPSASLTCTPSRTLCSTPYSTLPVRIAFEADHDGQLLVRYTDTTAQPRAFVTPVLATQTSVRTIRLPEAACGTSFEVSLLVEVQGLDPLDASFLPYATDAAGVPAQCTFTVQDETPSDLVGEPLVVDPADRITFTSTLAGFDALQNQAAFVVVSSVDRMIDPGEEVIEGAEPLGMARQTARVQQLNIELDRALIRGETVLISAYSDGGRAGVFMNEELLLKFEGRALTLEEGMELAPVYLQSSHVIVEVGTSEPFVSVAPTASPGVDTLSVLQSVSASGALLVLFDDESGRPGQPLGFTYVAPGVNQDVSVRLSRATRAGERVYVWLLEDGNANQRYDDIFTDPVFVRDAAPVAQLITIEQTP